MTKREMKRNMLAEMGIEYNEKRLDKMNMSWLEKAIEFYRSAEDKDNARRFVQQFIKRK